jgi:hypothetical protein
MMTAALPTTFIALTMAAGNASSGRSIKLRRKRAGWDPDFLADKLGQFSR